MAVLTKMIRPCLKAVLKNMAQNCTRKTTAVQTVAASAVRQAINITTKTTIVSTTSPTETALFSPFDIVNPNDSVINLTPFSSGNNLNGTVAAEQITDEWNPVARFCVSLMVVIFAAICILSCFLPRFCVDRGNDTPMRSSSQGTNDRYRNSWRFSTPTSGTSPIHLPHVSEAVTLPPIAHWTTKKDEDSVSGIPNGSPFNDQIPLKRLPSANKKNISANVDLAPNNLKENGTKNKKSLKCSAGTKNCNSVFQLNSLENKDLTEDEIMKYNQAWHILAWQFFIGREAGYYRDILPQDYKKGDGIISTRGDLIIHV